MDSVSVLYFLLILLLYIFLKTLNYLAAINTWTKDFSSVKLYCKEIYKHISHETASKIDVSIFPIGSAEELSIFMNKMDSDEKYNKSIVSE